MFDIEELFEKINKYKTLLDNPKGYVKFKKGLIYAKLSAKEAELVKCVPYLFVTADQFRTCSKEIQDLYIQKKEDFYKIVISEISSIIGKSNRLSNESTAKRLRDIISNAIVPYYLGRFRSIMSREISFLPLELRLFLYFEMLLKEEDNHTKAHLLERISVTLFKMSELEAGKKVILYYWLLRVEIGGFTPEIQKELTKNFAFLSNLPELRKEILTDRGFEEKRFLDEYRHSLLSFTDLSIIHDLESAKLMLLLWKEYYKEMPDIDNYFHSIRTFLSTKDPSCLANIPLDSFAKHQPKYVDHYSGNLLSSETASFYDKQIKEIVQHLEKDKRKLMLIDVAVEGRIGKNRPCPCGSGKKFKMCCMKNIEFTFLPNSNVEDRKIFLEVFERAKRGETVSQLSLYNYYVRGEVVKQDFQKAKNWLLSAANAGLLDAEHQLGVCYKNGLAGFPIDYKQAIYWLTRAAEKGKSLSQSILGVMYREGLGVEKNYKKALEWFEKSGDDHALVNMAYMYQNGQGVEKNIHRAIELYEKAAEKKNIDALYNLGCIYFSGVEGKVDLEKAKNYFKEAANQGDTEAERMLLLVKKKIEEGAMKTNKETQNEKQSLSDPVINVLDKYLKLIDIKDKSIENLNSEQIDFLHFAAEQGNGHAQIVLSVLYRLGKHVKKDLKKAFDLMKKAAEQEIDTALYLIGTMYFEGIGVKKNDTEAFRNISLAAEKGLQEAKVSLADCLIRGIGTKKDFKRAFSILLEEAQKGHTGAQSLLGSCYATGTGCDINYTEAVKWFKIAAEKGNSEAQFNLGLSYINGRGVPRNPMLAVKWWREAAKQGNIGAIQALSILYEF
jgi:uncharacterized protein